MSSEIQTTPRDEAWQERVTHLRFALVHIDNYAADDRVSELVREALALDDHRAEGLDSLHA